MRVLPLRLMFGSLSAGGEARDVPVLPAVMLGAVSSLSRQYLGEMFFVLTSLHSKVV